MDVLPNKNDVLIVEFGYSKQMVYVHERAGDFVQVGPKNWLVSSFEWWGLEDLTKRNAVVVGRCLRMWPFRIFRLKTPNVEVSGPEAALSPEGRARLPAAHLAEKDTK